MKTPNPLVFACLALLFAGPASAGPACNDLSLQAGPAPVVQATACAALCRR